MTLALTRRLVITVALGAVSCATEATLRPSDRVEALRFRQLIVESGMDFIHGGGAWHDVLYLPDAGVAVQVVWETDSFITPESGVREHPRMYAWHCTLEEALARPQEDAEGQKAPEKIEIPASLAKTIVELADLTNQQKQMSLRLARSAVEAKAVGGKETVRARE